MRLFAAAAAFTAVCMLLLLPVFCLPLPSAVNVCLPASSAVAASATSTPVSKVLVDGKHCQLGVRPTLRPYQTHDLSRLREATDSGMNPLYALPTGGGKTVIVAALVAAWEAENKSSLIVVHRRELLQQFEKMLTIFGVRAVVVGKGVECDSLTRITMIQTLARQSPVFKPPIDCVVVDEAHHSLAKSYRIHLTNVCGAAARYVGVTATPFRANGRGLAEFGWDTLIKGPSVVELIHDGFLVQPKYMSTI